jgi:hypothetical protein
MTPFRAANKKILLFLSNYLFPERIFFSLRDLALVERSPDVVIRCV